MLTAGKDNTLRLVDLRTLRPRLTLRSPGYAVGGVWTGAALGPDEKHAAAGPLQCGIDSGEHAGMSTTPTCLWSRLWVCQRALGFVWGC